MTEAPAEPPVRLGPAAANIARSIWHQKELLALGLVLGLALGWFALPKVLSSGSTYDATIRMKVLQAPVDAILKVPPAVGQDQGDDSSGASPDVLKDVVVADRVVEGLRKAKRLGAEDELTGPGLLDRLGITPLAGTPFVDLSFTDGNPRLAVAVVQRYAEEFASSRNKVEATRLQGRGQGSRGARQEARHPHGVGRALGGGPGRPRQDPPRPGEPGRRRQADDHRRAAHRGHQRPAAQQQGHHGPGPAARAGHRGRRRAAGGDRVPQGGHARPTLEEASGLPFIAEVRRSGIRRTPLPVIDRPFSPAAEDYRRVGTALERQGLGHRHPGAGHRLRRARGRQDDAGRQPGPLPGPPGPRGGPGLQRPAPHPTSRSCSASARGPAWPRPSRTTPSRRSPCWCRSTTTCWSCPPACRAGTRASCWPPSASSRRSRPCGRWGSSSSTPRRPGTRPTRSRCPSVADATLFVAKSGATRMRSVREATNGLRRDRIRQLGVVLVGTSSPLLRSMTTPRRPAATSPRPSWTSWSPRPSRGRCRSTRDRLRRPRSRVSNGDRSEDRASEVTDLNKAAERNRRAAE